MAITYRVEKASETSNKTIVIAEGVTSRKEAEGIANLFGGEVIAVFDVIDIMNEILNK